jgi:hypothetical protein
MVLAFRTDNFIGHGFGRSRFLLNHPISVVHKSRFKGIELVW